MFFGHVNRIAALVCAVLVVFFGLNASALGQGLDERSFDTKEILTPTDPNSAATDEDADQQRRKALEIERLTREKEELEAKQKQIEAAHAAEVKKLIADRDARKIVSTTINNIQIQTDRMVRCGGTDPRLPELRAQRRRCKSQREALTRNIDTRLPRVNALARQLDALKKLVAQHSVLLARHTADIAALKVANINRKADIKGLRDTDEAIRGDITALTDRVAALEGGKTTTSDSLESAPTTGGEGGSTVTPEDAATKAAAEAKRLEEERERGETDTSPMKSTTEKSLLVPEEGEIYRHQGAYIVVTQFFFFVCLIMAVVWAVGKHWILTAICVVVVLFTGYLLNSFYPDIIRKTENEKKTYARQLAEKKKNDALKTAKPEPKADTTKK